MKQYFLDTSGAVKYYHAEAGTPRVSAIFTEPERRIRISSLGFLEVQSAFAVKVRSGTLDSKSAGLQRSRFMLDIAAGDIEVYSITEDHFEIAERLIGRHSFRIDCGLSMRSNWPWRWTLSNRICSIVSSLQTRRSLKWLLWKG